MSASTTVEARAPTRAEALGRLWARVHLPLVAAPVGGVIGVVGCYRYWTGGPLQGVGGPKTGRLVGNRFGGVYLTAGKLVPQATVEPYVYYRRDVNLLTIWLFTLSLLALGLLGTFSPFFELFAPEECTIPLPFGVC